MATVPQTDTAQEPEPDHGSRQRIRTRPPRRQATPGSLARPARGRRRSSVEAVQEAPAGARSTDDADEPPVHPSLPGTEPTGLRRLLRHIEPLSQIARAARFYPARLAVIVFAAIIVVVTGLLSLPIATTSGERSDFLDACSPPPRRCASRA